MCAVWRVGAKKREKATNTVARTRTTHVSLFLWAPIRNPVPSSTDIYILIDVNQPTCVTFRGRVLKNINLFRRQ